MATDLAFTDFMSERQRPLLRFAMVLCGDTRLSEEIVADCLARAWERWDKIAAMDRPNAYVRRMIVNEYLSWRRRVQRTSPRANLTELLEQHSQSGRPATDHSSAIAERDAMISALARLPKKQRAAVVLRFYEGMSDAEIAETLGCEQTTVRSNTSRALATLRIDLHDADSRTTTGPIEH